MNCPKFLLGKHFAMRSLIMFVMATFGAAAPDVRAQSAGDLVPVANPGQPVAARSLGRFARADKNKQFTVVLKLADDPVAVVRSRMPGKRLRDEDAQTIVKRLRAKQDALVPAIQSQGVPILARFQHALNGIKIRATADQIAALSRLPGVVEVKQVGTYYLNNAESVPFIGTPAVWAGPPGLRGEHIKVAIIDTGIDYTHANFGGPGTVAAFQAAKATNTQPADPTLFGPNAPKVKGGTDLVGDNYTGSNTPVPDPNPLDCNGHGSHTAGTAAGFGVLADGSTFHGPYDNTTPSRSFTIGPGVAPLADIYSVRVFGCTGSTNVVIDAIEWAVANGMQVISMSLGADFGTKNGADSEAATNAENAGVIVVAASGNSGLIPYITSGPADGDKAISVAAMDSHVSFPGATLALSPSGSILAQDSDGVTFSDGTTLGVVVLPDTAGTGINGISLGCDPAEYTAAGVAGKLVVTARGNCARIDRAIYGQQAGAAAVAMVNNAAGFGVYEGPITANPDTGAPFNVTIPFLGIQGLPATDSSTLKTATSVTLSNATVANPTGRQVASFSSGGPRLGDGYLKPEISAPGVSIFSTASGTGNGGLFESGTSMATPHVAGVSALTLQAHPTWDPDKVRLAVVNTADSTQLVGYSTKLAGAGLVQPFPASLTSVVAQGNNDAPSLSFGLQEFSSDFSGTQDITLQNFGSQTASFTTSTTPNTTSSPHSVEVDPSSVSVPAGGTATLHVKVSIPAATNGDSSTFRDVAGVVTLNPATPSDNAGVALHVPYYVVSRARSQISTTIGQSFGPSNPSTTAQISNSSLSVSGIAQIFSWGLTGQHSNFGFFGLRAVGVQTLSSSLGPIVRFAVNTFAPLGTASAAFDVEVDTFLAGNTTNVPDYAIYTEDFGRATTGTTNGQVAVVVLNVATGAAHINFLASAPTDGSTYLLPVYASDLGLSAANPRFSYIAFSDSGYNPDFSFSSGATFDSITEKASFNAFNNSISTGAAVNVLPGSSVNVPLSLDANEFTNTPAQGVMVVALDNLSGSSQAQLLSLASPPPVLQSITLAPSSASVAAGLTQSFAATGNYSDNSTQDLTNTVTWTSTDTTIASIDATGLATGVKAGGPVTISAQQGNVKGTAQLTVTPAVLQSITVIPSMASVTAGLTQPFSATGHYSDSSTQDLTNAVAWTSSDTTIATINSSGVATGVKAGGPVTISAQQGSVKGTAQLTVTANNVSVTVNTLPAGETFSVDKATYSTAQTFTFASGTTHTISTTSPQSGTPGTQFSWLNWSDGGGISHQITTPSSAVTYTANFSTQFQLLTSASPTNGGSVTPVSGNYYDAGTVVNLTATANAGFTFTGWSGNVANANSFTTTVTMNSPQSVAANFAPIVPATVIDYRVLFGSEGYSLLGSTRNRLPWQITGIQVVFSKAITSGDRNSLSGVPTTGFAGLGTNTLTWSINPLVVGNIATALVTIGLDALKDATGTPAAPFSENFSVLYGDYNDDGAVSSADMVAVNSARSAAYNIFADLNGDAVVDLTDVQIVRSRIGTTLP